MVPHTQRLELISKLHNRGSVHQSCGRCCTRQWLVGLQILQICASCSVGDLFIHVTVLVHGPGKSEFLAFDRLITDAISCIDSLHLGLVSLGHLVHLLSDRIVRTMEILDLVVNSEVENIIL